MEQYLPYLIYIVAAIVIALLLKFVWHFGFKKILGFILNILIGALVLHLVNYIPGVDIPLNLITSIIVGLAGLPGVILLLIYYLIIK